MKIVQIGKYYPPESGGIETVTADLARGFSERGWVSGVIAFTNDRSEDATRAGVKIVRRRFAAVVASQPIGVRWILAAVRAGRSADVALIHAPNPLAAFVSPFLGRCRSIVYWHSDIVDKGLLGYIVKPLEAIILRRASQIWVTSKVYGESSLPLARYRDKVRILPIGIRDVAHDSIAELSDDVVAFLRGRRFALSVGRLVPYKGFSDLLNAVAEISSDIAIVIAGAGPLEAELNNEIGKLGLRDRVLLAGRVSDDLLQALFANASLFVMSSNRRSEAFGVVLLEAMAFGLPIVATDIEGSGVSWVSGNGELGAVAPVGAPGALAKAITQIFESDSLPALRERSRARYQQLFRVDTMIEGAVGLIGAEAGA